MSVHVRLLAEALGKSQSTVWRWLATATPKGAWYGSRRPGSITTEVRRSLALWGGNASQVHSELVRRAQEQQDTPAAPSLATLHRAIRRDLGTGEWAGLRSGEDARRAHDVFGPPPTATTSRRATTSTCPSRSKANWFEERAPGALLLRSAPPAHARPPLPRTPPTAAQHTPPSPSATNRPCCSVKTRAQTRHHMKPKKQRKPQASSPKQHSQNNDQPPLPNPHRSSIRAFLSPGRRQRGIL